MEYACQAALGIGMGGASLQQRHKWNVAAYDQQHDDSVRHQQEDCGNHKKEDHDHQQQEDPNCQQQD